jgi:hypothetical protein
MAQAFNFAPAYETEARSIERRRRMAEMLQGQAMAPIDPNRMAGGYVVPISPVEGLAKMAQAWAAGRSQKRADGDARQLGETMQADRAETLRRALEAGQGTPMIPDVPEELGGGPGRPAMPGSARAMYEVLSGSKDPMQAQMGMQGMLKSMEVKQPKWERTTIRNPDGTTRVGFVDTNAASPETTFRELGVEPVKTEMVNTGGQITPLNPYAPQGPLQVTPAPSSVPFDAQDMTPEQYRQFKLTQAERGASRTTNVNNVSAGDRAWDVELAKEDVKQLGEFRNNAIKAQSILRTAENLREAVKSGVYSGGGAELKTSVASFINGMTGATPKGLPGSEQFIAESGKLVLDLIKQLGHNPSNADLAFIQRVVPSLGTSPQARTQLIDYLERTARGQIDLFQRADEYGRANRSLRGFQYGGPQAPGNPGNPGNPPAPSAAPVGASGSWGEQPSRNVPTPPPGFTVNPGR